jgi:hypothetical protein
MFKTSTQNHIIRNRAYFAVVDLYKTSSDEHIQTLKRDAFIFNVERCFQDEYPNSSSVIEFIRYIKTSGASPLLKPLELRNLFEGQDGLIFANIVVQMLQ